MIIFSLESEFFSQKWAFFTYILCTFWSYRLHMKLGVYLSFDQRFFFASFVRPNKSLYNYWQLSLKKKSSNCFKPVSWDRIFWSITVSVKLLLNYHFFNSTFHTKHWIARKKLNTPFFDKFKKAQVGENSFRSVANFPKISLL